GRELVLETSPPPLAAEVDDPVLAPLGGPRNLLIVLSDDLVRFVEIEEQRFERPGHRAVSLDRSGRVDMHGEIFAARVSGKCQPVAFERTDELDWIAVRPVERTSHNRVLLLEHELQSELLLDR